MRLDEAARALGTDADTLLLGAIEGRLRLYMLFGDYRTAALGKWEPIADDPYGKVWAVSEMKHGQYIDFVPITNLPDIATVMSRGSCDVHVISLSEADEEGRVWMAHRYPGDDFYPDTLCTRETIYLKRDQVELMLSSTTSATAPNAPSPSMPAAAGLGDRRHVSNHLAALNQAAVQFWANADPDEPETHPDNAEVALWLQRRGLSPTLSAKGASIIRPDWAHNGRKPER